MNMTIFWEAYSTNIQAIDYTHMFVSENSSSFSTIDHFVSNNQVLNAITEAGVLHNSQNTSNHSPIFVKIYVGHLQVNTEESKSSLRTSWAKASRDRPIVPNRLILAGITNRYRYYEISTNRYRYRLNLLSINRLKLETLNYIKKHF